MTSLDLLVTLFLMHPRMPLAFTYIQTDRSESVPKYSEGGRRTTLLLGFCYMDLKVRREEEKRGEGEGEGEGEERRGEERRGEEKVLLLSS
ncbi:hypothetical protein llap_20493 [Limosa lapponica baueri]|uniref:Uncharacterized protein n=1 Tax=Limosa lapponica baueri TaxID=1758121 RepID=A0A2I0T5Y2_LIMLA|nr:hypothetical protein llap_20493 [Limosa lapponica baueri]